MRLGLNMIVKNEAHIIREVMTCTLPLIDTYVIVDTGSTDNTIQVIKDFYKEHGIQGHVFERPWKNFGHNRSEAIKLCDGHMDYCMVIDADDLMNIPKDGKKILNTLLEQEKPNNLNVKIHEGGVIYSRGQIFKANDNWRYIGVLHEYAGNGKPDNKTIELPENFFMTSRRLGGRNLTGDKQQKDIALLEQGVKDEPDNDRYMYYLGQSYLDAGRVDDAIVWYKKRFHIGRWIEESFHAAYKVGECYLRKQDIIRFEKWMQIAHKHHPARAEPIYQLASFFRKTAQFYKSYHYIQLGRKIPYPKDDVLFVESFPHKGGFDFEASIVECYTHPDKNVGLRSSIVYLLKLADFRDLVITNLKYYVQPIISNSFELLKIPSVFGYEFRPTAVSVLEYPYANVRFVNYLPPTDGQYRTRDGSTIKTQNAYINIETGECISKIQEETTPPFSSNISGLEDMRLYTLNNKIYFTATSYKEYIQNKISIVHGEYDITTNLAKKCIGINSPFNQECEKNWVHIPDTDEFIYSWYPLRTGKIIGNRFIYNREIKTPPFFETFRGSAPPLKWDTNKWIVLVHFVEYCTPRKYYHCFVELDSGFNPTRVSLPFVFKMKEIEYCISTVLKNDVIQCFPSFNDSNPHKLNIKISDLQWVDISNINTSISTKDSFVRIPAELDSYWHGGYSVCVPNNAIETFVRRIATSIENTPQIIMPKSDGLIATKEYTKIAKSLGTNNVLMREDDYNKFPNTSIVAMICSRGYSPSNLLLLPLDDNTFHKGLNSVLSSMPMIDWSSRSNKLFWRGGASGFDDPSLRFKVTTKLFEHPNADVRITKWGNWENGKNIPEKYFAPRCNIDTHFQYKYIPIIDGNCIASNHQWVFGSGAVPVMITHPDNNYWFKKYLIPMVNYVPVNYDLSDLVEKLEWLLSHDDEAHKIAENAVTLSNTIFTPSFQQWYVQTEINRIVLNNTSMIVTQFNMLSKIPSDIHEHLPTLFEYAKKCDSVVECGVRSIVSSYAFASGLLENKNNMFTMVDPMKSSEMDGFLAQCNLESIHAKFIHESDLVCDPIQTDLLFIDTWHVYGQLKRELAHWHQSVKKYIIMHDTTVDEWQGETVRCCLDAAKQSQDFGIPVEEINKGLWPAIDEFLKEHSEWVIEKRYTNNNGLTILARS